jgi:exopolyphosphatase/pppGpp-phosphohydrolase
VQRLVLTGGTASHIAWLAGRADRVSDLALEDLDRVLQELTEHTADEIVRKYDIMPERARVLPAGAVAVRAIAEYYRVSDVTVTRNGIREGAIIEYLQRAGRWPSTSRSSQG